VPREEPLNEPPIPIPPPLVKDPTPGAARFALHFVYDSVWALAFVVCSPWWILRCLLDRRFRALSIARSFGPLPGPRAPGARPRLLVHGVSVGEVKAARPLVEALRGEYDIVICTVTDTGQDVARKLYPGLAVLRFPLDFSPLVARFLSGVDPACVILIELELWPSFLRVCNRRGIPLCVANGRITDRSFPRYRLFKSLLPQFARISLFCAQDEEYAARFRELGADPARVRVTGNIKADGLKSGFVEPRAEIRALLGGGAGQQVLVAGSTHAPEERWVAQAWAASVPEARLVLVPRHPGRASEICEELAALGLRPQRLTALRAGEKPDPRLPALVDTIGELEQVYALADLVFVGGSLIPHGGQNVLEPAALGRAVVYGPHLANFLQEALLLERAGASRRLSGEEELGAAFRELLADRELAQRMGQAGMRAVEAQKGASARTLETLRRGCLEPLAAAGARVTRPPAVLS
jgi:3-deoxy-D-manno-octulosonic-acid transferase